MKTQQALIRQASLLGQLLTTAGILNVEVISEAYQATKNGQGNMGEMLVQAGYLSECDLKCALEAVKEVESGALAHDQAAHALKYAYDQCLPFMQALELTVLKASSVVNPNLIGELLLQARLVSDYQLSVAMAQSKDCGLTLGRILVLTQIITPGLLEAAVECLRLVRDRVLNFEQAVQTIRLVVRQRLSVIEAVAKVAPDSVPNNTRPKLGSLLSGAGIVAEFDALNAAEVGLESNKPIGQVLHEYGLVSNLVIKAGLKLQSLLEGASVTLGQAYELLRQVNKLQVPVEELLKELTELKGRVLAFLIQAGVVTHQDIKQAISIDPRLKDDPAQALINAGLVKAQLVRDCARCTWLIERGKLKRETALTAISYCHRGDMTLEEALKQLQVETSTRLAAVCTPALAGGAA